MSAQSWLCLVGYQPDVGGQSVASSQVKAPELAGSHAPPKTLPLLPFLPRGRVPGEEMPDVAVTEAGPMINRLPASLYPVHSSRPARVPLPAAALQSAAPAPAAPPASQQFALGPTGQITAAVTLVLGIAAIALWQMRRR